LRRGFDESGPALGENSQRRFRRKLKQFFSHQLSTNNHQLIMSKPAHHIFVCGSFRPTGAAGVCHKKESSRLLQHLSTEVQDRSLDDVMVSSTGCLNMCDSGPVVVVYPENIWYKHATIETAEAILDSLEEKAELPPATLFA
jgi:(2Fe-2S) ferredoxin